MPLSQPKYSKEEFARRGDEHYNRIRGLVEPAHQDEIVAIDIESGDWEVDPDEIAACQRLAARHPGAQIWIVRVGRSCVRRYGRGGPAARR
ncbi:MAG TPA: hypothetical protein VGM03_22780 [Phycisphaerae bacterium]|jgi:hypothetical protein